MKKKQFFFPLLIIALWLAPVLCYANQDSLLIKKNLASQLYKEAGKLVSQGRFEQSNQNLIKSANIKNELYGDNCAQNISTYFNLGRNYYIQNKFDEGLNYLKQAEANAIKHFGKNFPNIGRIYNLIGLIYKAKGDYEKALDYFGQGLTLLRTDSVRKASSIIDCHINIANTYLNQEDYKKSINYCNNLLKNRTNPALEKLYNNLAFSHSQLNNNKKATYYFKKFINYHNQQSNNSLDLGIAYNNYADYLFDNRQFDSIPKYLNLSIPIFKQRLGDKHSYLSQSYINLGNYYAFKPTTQTTVKAFQKEKLNNLRNALINYQQSIITVVDSFSKMDPMINPILKNRLNDNQLLDALNRKAQILALYAENIQQDDNKLAISYFHKAFETYELSTQLIHEIRSGFLSRDSKLLLAANERDTYQNTIEVATKLNQLTDSVFYLNKAFEYAEKSKSATFLAAVRDIEAKAFGGIPDTFLIKEKEIKQELAFYQEQIFNALQSLNPDTEKINYWKTEIFEIKKQHERLTDFFEQEYPEYYSLKYKNNVITIPEIQKKLDKDDALLEYVLEEPNTINNQGLLHTFIITNNHYELLSIPIDSVFYKAITTTQNFLINTNVYSTRKEDYINYCKSAYKLYEKLIKPAGSIINGKNLIVVPDDKLAYIPFDALISSTPDESKKMNFKKLQYLIKEYAFSYSYSATLLYDYFKAERTAKNNLLAINPTYTGSMLNTPQKDNLWATLMPLAGASQEVKEISNLISSHKLVGEKATEGNFKKVAEDYDILHLAMHTLVNDSIPMFSKLVFTKDDNSTQDDDNLLNTQEIYNMHLNARMAVLSACNTGSGKLHKGEGVMSLARGFLYAGCPSIVMTLWEVDDLSSANIIKDFYKYLHNGKSKSEALRKAKLNHLEEADAIKAHPYFWLSYVSVGDQNPLYVGSHFTIFMILLFALFLWFIFDLYKSKNKLKLQKRTKG
ncbi:CHAT domain-containing protein [Puteibacter caeruleilacunae]|nr:CHAT domain-containing protein [Puteibacter caeruleilacunae]